MLCQRLVSYRPEMIPTDDVRARLAAFPNGTQLVVRYHHVRDADTIRTIRGPIFKSGNAWVMKPTSTQRFRLPSDTAVILQITVLHPPSRAHSEVPDESDQTPLGEGREPSSEQQRRPVQPSAEPSAAALLDAMRRHQEFQDRTFSFE